LPGRRAEAVRAALTARGWPTRLAVGWTIGWPEWQREFHAAYAAADAVVFNNRIYWEETGRLPRTRVIANGVDLRTFRVIVPPARRRPRVLWLGSEFHRARKGYDDIVLPLRERLRADGIECDFRLVDFPRRRPSHRRADGRLVQLRHRAALRQPPRGDAERRPRSRGLRLHRGRAARRQHARADPRRLERVPRRARPRRRHRRVRKACAAYPRLAAAMAEAIAAWDWSACCRAHFALFDELSAPEWRRDAWS
jgi:hypothetical protein